MTVTRLSPTRRGIRTVNGRLRHRLDDRRLVSDELVRAQAATTSLVVDRFDRTVASGFGTATTGGLWSSYGDSVLSVSGDCCQGHRAAPGKSVGSSLAPSAADTDVQSTLRLPNLGSGRRASSTPSRPASRPTAPTIAARSGFLTPARVSLSFSRTSGTAETALGTLALPLVAAKNQTSGWRCRSPGRLRSSSRAGSGQKGRQRPTGSTSSPTQTPPRSTAAGSVGLWAYAGSTGNTGQLRHPGIPGQQDRCARHCPPVPPEPGTVKPTDANTGVPAGTTLTDYTGP